MKQSAPTAAAQLSRRRVSGTSDASAIADGTDLMTFGIQLCASTAPINRAIAGFVFGNQQSEIGNMLVPPQGFVMSLNLLNLSGVPSIG